MRVVLFGAEMCERNKKYTKEPQRINGLSISTSRQFNGFGVLVPVDNARGIAKTVLVKKSNDVSYL